MSKIDANRFFIELFHKPNPLKTSVPQGFIEGKNNFGERNSIGRKEGKIPQNCKVFRHF
jgi:hypothetical protein